MAKATDFMGLIPAIAGRTKKQNRGFALGLLPGLLYRDKQKRKQEEEKRQGKTNQQLAMEGASQVGQASSTKMMKKGGKVAKASKYKSSHNRLYPVKKQGRKKNGSI
ncbi:MAG: hypothetical protein VW518_01250 [Burkholderiaceae bacterium]